MFEIIWTEFARKERNNDIFDTCINSRWCEQDGWYHNVDEKDFFRTEYHKNKVSTAFLLLDRREALSSCSSSSKTMADLKRKRESQGQSLIIHPPHPLPHHTHTFPRSMLRLASMQSHGLFSSRWVLLSHASSNQECKRQKFIIFKTFFYLNKYCILILTYLQQKNFFFEKSLKPRAILRVFWRSGATNPFYELANIWYTGGLGEGKGGFIPGGRVKSY